MMRAPLLLALIFLCADGNSHEAHHEKIPEPEKKKVEQNLQPVIESYQQRVELLFKRTCFDCHSDQTNYPWYSRLPLVRRMIKNDIQEARKHMDMSAGFPFKGHGTVEEDLNAIKNSISKNEMPPLRYRFMHSKNELSIAEKEIIVGWVDEALAGLNP
jgi:hypothetical protein